MKKLISEDDEFLSFYKL